MISQTYSILIAIVVVVLGCKVSQCEDTVLFSLNTTNVFNIDNGFTQTGFLYYPTPHNGCQPLKSPPSNSTWFALLDDFETCTIEKIINTRDAGYQLLFVDNPNPSDSVIDNSAVIATGFPVVIINKTEFLTHGVVTTDSRSMYVTVEHINNPKANYSYISLNIYAFGMSMPTKTTTDTLPSETDIVRILVPAIIVSIFVILVIFVPLIIIKYYFILRKYRHRTHHFVTEDVEFANQHIYQQRTRRHSHMHQLSSIDDDQFEEQLLEAKLESLLISGQRNFASDRDAAFTSECLICQINFERGDTIVALPCDPMHFFHNHCIKRALNDKHECPLCRRNPFSISTTTSRSTNSHHTTEPLQSGPKTENILIDIRESSDSVINQSAHMEDIESDNTGLPPRALPGDFGHTIHSTQSGVCPLSNIATIIPRTQLVEQNINLLSWDPSSELKEPAPAIHTTQYDKIKPSSLGLGEQQQLSIHHNELEQFTVDFQQENDEQKTQMYMQWHQPMTISLPLEDSAVHISQDQSIEYPSAHSALSGDPECKQLDMKKKLKYHSCASNVARVPFLDEVIVLECDHSGREYYNVDHDVTVTIPQGAISEGQIIHFELAVALYGPFSFPHNERPISPILWICLQEDITLRKPLKIILPHYLTGLSEEELISRGVGFIKASHNEYITDEYGQRLYHFKHNVVGRQHFYSNSDINTGRSYGVLHTSRCCYICIKDERCHEHALKAGFCLHYIQSRTLSPLSQREEIYFSGTFCLPSCIKALEQQFPPEDYKISTEHFKFEDRPNPHLRLAVSTTNADTSTIALKPTAGKIFQSRVDFWQAGYNYEQMKLKHDRKMYPPCVQVTIGFNSDTPHFVVDFMFKGCQKIYEEDLNMQLMLPRDSSFIFRSPSSSGYSSTSIDALSVPSKSITAGIPFDMTQLTVLKYTDPTGKTQTIRVIQTIQTQWRKIGRLLGIKPQEINTIRVKWRDDPDDCCTAVLNRWLENGSNNYPLSWEGLIKLLKDIEFTELARELQQT